MNDLNGNTIISMIETEIQHLISEMNNNLDKDMLLETAEQLEQLEQSYQKNARELADLMLALQLQKTILSTSLKDNVKQLIKLSPKRYRHVGWRTVNIRFGSIQRPISIAYYARNCDRKKKKNKGIYPGLILLGIHDRCTPGLISEISLTSAALCSFEEARLVLQDRGIKLNIKTIRNVAKRFAARARLLQKQDDTLFLDDTETIKNRRVVVSVDGGRIRIRKTKRGPKTKKGRARFHTDWKEPKLFIIYVVNDKGRLDHIFSPYIDGIMGGPDALFELLTYYLIKIGISTVDKCLFIADGALWIWDRVKTLMVNIGLKAEQIIELLDFYHAIEHLNCIAKLKCQWTEKQRKAWIKKNRRRLKNGESNVAIDAIKLACKGTKNKLLKRERAYFIKNSTRLNYKAISDLNMPMGSGAVESSIRRVINLRLKGPCIFWNEDSANEMLMLRCYYKAGRWNMLKRWSSLVVTQ